MAATPLIRDALPGEPELQSFARTAAHLLVERQPRAAGARAVSRRAGAGLQHLDHRPYLPGDEVRHIDWRLTARSRQPIVRRFELEAVSDWTLLLDASASMAVLGAAKWRAAVHLAAALSYALLQLGHRVRLLAFGGRVLAECPAGRGQPHYAAIARLLATLQPAPAGERSDLGVCARHLRGAASVVVLSDFLADGEMARDLAALLQRCAALQALQLRHASETQWPAPGETEVVLVDVETGAQRLSRDDGQPVTPAARERAAMTARLQAWCARSHVAFTDWDIAEPWQRALLRHLVQAQSRC